MVDKQAAAMTEQERLMISFGSFHPILGKLRNLGLAHAQLPRPILGSTSHSPFMQGPSIRREPLLAVLFQMPLTILCMYTHILSLLFATHTLAGYSFIKLKHFPLSLYLPELALCLFSSSGDLTQRLERKTPTDPGGPVNRLAAQDL